MSVTVLMPVYNGAATLRQALDSILAQDLGGIEVLVVDDASTDGSACVAAEYATRDPRVSALVNEQNLGLAATLNHGLELARHELVARMDQDDEALPGRLRYQLEFMTRNPGIVVAGTFVYNMGATREQDRLVRLPVTPREIGRTLPRENCLYHPSVVLRRTPVIAAGGYRAEFRNAEDYELWLRLSRHHDLANIPLPLLRYRLSPGGMTLAGKWEQLYYVSLAQASFREPALSLAEAHERALEELSHVDRSRFMEQVTTAAVRELGRLGLWRDAVSVLRALGPEVRPRLRIALAASLVREQLQS